MELLELKQFAPAGRPRGRNLSVCQGRSEKPKHSQLPPRGKKGHDRNHPAAQAYRTTLQQTHPKTHDDSIPQPRLPAMAVQCCPVLPGNLVDHHLCCDAVLALVSSQLPVSIA
eukprot:3856111-Rhodomonas_salina.2